LLFERRKPNWPTAPEPRAAVLNIWRRKAGDDDASAVSADGHFVPLWHQIAQSVSIAEEDNLLVARPAQGLIGACHSPPKPAEYPEVEELLDCFKQNTVTLDPSILVECFPMPSATNKFLERVAAEDTNGEVWLSEFDVLAKTTEIARLLKWLCRKTSRPRFPHRQESAHRLLLRSCRDHD
jgi:hypothetical protein